jgi:murein L,D-transpeptidase YcbB/YkuD
VLNVPAYRLDAFEDGLRRSFPVAVGMPRYTTPRGHFAVTAVEWNPWWIPPDRPWAAGERPMPPGPNNPMGRVKLHFRPLYFIHGTPADSSIGRAASHGCVRMHNADATALARLVHAHGTPGLMAAELERLAASTAPTRRVELEHPVPLEIRYARAEVRDDTLLVHPDVYGLASRPPRHDVLVALAGAGVDTLRVPAGRVDELLRRARRETAAIPVESLLLATP